MSFYVYQQLKKESYDRMVRNYFKFIANTSNPDTEPVTVYSPLSEKMLEELELIREVSRDLQLKKIEEDEKAREAAENSKKEKEKVEETNEDTENSEANVTEEQKQEATKE